MTFDLGVVYLLCLHIDTCSACVQTRQEVSRDAESEKLPSYHVSFRTLRTIDSSNTLKRTNREDQTSVSLVTSREERWLTLRTGAPGDPGGPRGPSNPLGPCEERQVRAFTLPATLLVTEEATIIAVEDVKTYTLAR